MASLAPSPAAFEVRSGRLPCHWDEDLERFYLWETGDGWLLLNPGATSLVAGSISLNADSASSTHTKFGSSRGLCLTAPNQGSRPRATAGPFRPAEPRTSAGPGLDYVEPLNTRASLNGKESPCLTTTHL